MKILLLCKKFPYPLNCGEAIAVSYLSKALYKQGCEITLLAMNTTKHPFDLKDLPESYNFFKKLVTVDIDNQVTTFGAFKNLFSTSSYHVDRFVSNDYALKLKELLLEDRYDVVQLETLYLSPYIGLIRQYSDALVVMRAHNIEHEIWHRIGENTHFFPKRWYLGYLADKLKNFELAALSAYDFLVPISDRDLKKYRALGYKNGAHTIPIGLDLSAYNYQKIDSALDLSVSFIGGFDWLPNKEGILWFLDKIWPSLHKKFPRLKLHVAGRNMPKVMLKYRSMNVVAEGDVEDSREFMLRHPISLVPILSGSGTRVKILEAMALGRIVVSTGVGLEGIDVVHKNQVLVADDLAGFTDAFSFLYGEHEEIERMSMAARDFVKKHYDYDVLAEQLILALKSYVGRDKIPA